MIWKARNNVDFQHAPFDYKVIFRLTKLDCEKYVLAIANNC